MRRDIGDLLLEERLITEGVLRAARRLAKRERLPVVVVLLDERHLSEQQLVDLLSRRLNLQVADLSRVEIDEDVLRLVPYDLAEKHRALPLSSSDFGRGGVLRVAMADPLDRDALDELHALTGHAIDPLIAPAGVLASVIRSRYRGSMNRRTPWPPAATVPMRVRPSITPDQRVRPPDVTVTQPLLRPAEDLPVEVQLRALLLALTESGILSEHAYADALRRVRKEEPE